MTELTELFVSVSSILMIVLMCVKMYYTLKYRGNDWINFSVYALVIVYIVIILNLAKF